jgi:hypothetical protein
VRASRSGWLILVPLLVITAPAHGADEGAPDAAAPAPRAAAPRLPVATPADAGPPVAAPADAGPPVAAPADAGPPVAAPADAGPPEAARVEAGPPDAALLPERADAGPAPTGSEAPSGGDAAAVELSDRPVFSLRVDRAGRTAEQRAREASEALKKAFQAGGPGEVRVELDGGARVVCVDGVPIVRLTAADAEAAGDESLEVHAGLVATALRDAIRGEKRRQDVVRVVYSIALAVFLALITFLVLVRTSALFRRAAAWVHDNPQRIPALRVRSIEVMSPGVVRSTVLLALTLLRWVIIFGIVYLWLILALSPFEAARRIAERLGSGVARPLSGLFARLVQTLPLLLVAAVALLGLALLLRMVRLFFEQVRAGEVQVRWLAPDLAAPTSVLLRAAVVLAALVFAAPVVTGSSEGPLPRLGLLLFGAAALAATPLGASLVVGIVMVYLRRVHPGEFVSVGALAGRVEAVSLLELRLTNTEGALIRVPHLFLLFHPLAVRGRAPVIEIEVGVAGATAPESVCGVLRGAAERVGEHAGVELVHLGGAAARYRVRVQTASADGRHRLLVAIAAALAEAGLAAADPPRS